MRMSRLYIDAVLRVGEAIQLERTQAHYLRNVLRLKPGAAFFLFNGREQTDYRASLAIDGKEVSARIESAQASATESSLDSHLLQGLGRADHVDWMIQKTTELGVTRIGIFNAARSQGRLKPSQLDKKLQHWRKIAVSACEQCGRTLVPDIVFHGDLESALVSVDQDLRLLLDMGGSCLSSGTVSAAAGVAVVLGPEGGLNSNEIEQCKAAGFVGVGLGPRVLRTETAAVTALALLQSTLGDL